MINADVSAIETRFTRWVTEFGSIIQAYIQSRVYDRATAEDLTQDTFCRAWSARYEYQEQGSPKKYLFCIAERLIIDYRRKRKAQLFADEQTTAALEPIDNNQSAEEKLVLAENTQKLQFAMKELSDIQQQILMLRFYGQFTFAEISEMVNTPLNTTLSHCRRALEKLRGYLGDLQI